MRRILSSVQLIFYSGCGTNKQFINIHLLLLSFFLFSFQRHSPSERDDKNSGVRFASGRDGRCAPDCQIIWLNGLIYAHILQPRPRTGGAGGVDDDDDKQRQAGNNIATSKRQRVASRCCARRQFTALIARIIIPRNGNGVANDRRCLRALYPRLLTS